MSKGLDVGTSFIVLSSHIAHDTVGFKDFRDAFCIIKPTNKIASKMIEKGLAGKVFVKDKDGSFIILGQDAITKALEKNESPKRPMFRGVVSPREKDSKKILSFILQEVVGKAKEDGEKLVFCVPAQPIDQADEDFDVSYHEDVLKTIIEQYGYNVKVIEEAVAIGYEGLVDTQLTGVAISMGAGMCNIAVMYQGMTALSFSVSRGGDWVDENVSMDTGVSKAKVTNIKETSTTLDLSSATYQNIYEEETDDANVLIAIRSYYGALINYLLTNLKVQFEGVENVPNFPESVPIVIGGGTALVKGFLDVFNEQFDQDSFPIPVSEIILIEDAHTAVSRGCLSEAQLIEEDDEENNS